MNNVQNAVEYYDNVVHPLILLMYQADTFEGLQTSGDDVGTLIMNNSRFIRDNNNIQLYCSTELCPDVLVMSIFKRPSMLYRYNSVGVKSVGVSHTVLGNKLGFGVADAENSTVTILDRERYKRLHQGNISTREIALDYDIRNRTEELNFELLLDMHEDYIVSFIINSLVCQHHPGLDVNIFCDPELLHVPELAFKQLQRKLENHNAN